MCAGWKERVGVWVDGASRTSSGRTETPSNWRQREEARWTDDIRMGRVCEVQTAHEMSKWSTVDTTCDCLRAATVCPRSRGETLARSRTTNERPHCARWPANRRTRTRFESKSANSKANSSRSTWRARANAAKRWPATNRSKPAGPDDVGSWQSNCAETIADNKVLSELETWFFSDEKILFPIDFLFHWLFLRKHKHLEIEFELKFHMIAKCTQIETIDETSCRVCKQKKKSKEKTTTTKNVFIRTNAKIQCKMRQNT